MSSNICQQHSVLCRYHPTSVSNIQFSAGVIQHLSATFSSLQVSSNICQQHSVLCTCHPTSVSNIQFSVGVSLKVVHTIHFLKFYPHEHTYTCIYAYTCTHTHTHTHTYARTHTHTHAQLFWSTLLPYLYKALVVLSQLITGRQWGHTIWAEIRHTQIKHKHTHTHTHTHTESKYIHTSKCS